jgi:serine/threonine protein kinase/tetratricopeptide (TPR) repeat protein
MVDLPKTPARYTLIDEIGEGATCTVYRAQDALLGREVAIKVARRNLAIHARFRTRFAREVTLSAEVVHPRVIPVLDTGVLECGRPFVSLAHADQGSLSDLLKRRPPMAEALRVIDQVLDALAHMHARGFLHQDLKPANVLLHSTASGETDAWVADLGVAGAVAELALHQRGMGGTPAWMAPEQRAGHYAELGPWTDLYAVGLMLFEILGGDRSGKEAGTRRLLDPLPSGPLGLNPDVPDALRAVVRTLLQPDPRERYDRAADVGRAIRSALSDQQLTMPVPPPIGGHVGQSFSNILVQEGIESLTATSHVPVPETGVQWNRVTPNAMPMEPPPHPGSGAEHGGLAMVSMRDPPIEAHEDVRWLLWQQARAVVQTGEPRVVFLVGDSDIGKSRTAHSVTQTIEASGHMEAVHLRYHQPPGANDGYRGAVQEILAPWNDNREALQARLARWLSRDQQRSPDAVTIEASVLARWCGYMTEDETPVNAAVGLAFLYRHLDARSWRGGALLLLEDAHLAQEAGDGLNICDAVLEQSIGERPFLVIATLSEQALREDPALQEQVQSMERRGAIRVNLPRMSEGEMRAFLRQTMNIEPALSEAVAPLCEGSPERALLMIRDWATRGHLVQMASGELTLDPLVSLDEIAHEDMSALFLSRIRGAVDATEAPEDAYEALAATALAGQAPPALVVREINPGGLDALLATGLVRQKAWRLVFEHHQIHTAAMAVALGRPGVADLHKRLANAWTRLGEWTGADVDLPVGSHRWHAGDPNSAVVPLLRAARRTYEEGRFALSLSASKLGVAAADKAGGLSARAEARIRQAEALMSQQSIEAAIQIIQEASNLGHLDRRTAARLDLALAHAETEQGNLEAARHHLESASITFEATQDREGLIETAGAMALVYRTEGRPAEAARCFARMLRMNRGDKRTDVQALYGLVDARAASGRLKGIAPMVQQLRRTAIATGDTRRMAKATFAAGLVRLANRDIDEAERHFHTARALAVTVGDHRLQLDSENNLGEVFRMRGDARSAERMYEGVARLAVMRGWPSSAAIAHLNLAIVSQGREDQNLARIAIDQAEACLAQLPQHWAWMVIGVVRAAWAAELGDEANTRAWWAVAIDHGLGRVVSYDMLGPLDKLAAAAVRQEWNDLAARAVEYRDAIAHSDPNLQGEAG